MGDGFRTALHTFARFGDFAGRSRRTELLLFWLLLMVANMILMVASRPLGWAAYEWAMLGFQVAVALPTGALFVRRLHDVGWSGWWLAPLVPIVALGIWERIQRIDDPFQPRFEPPLAVQILAGLYAVAVMVLLFWDDQEGDNRYGPNPRTGPVETT